MAPGGKSEGILKDPGITGCIWCSRRAADGLSGEGWLMLGLIIGDRKSKTGWSKLQKPDFDVLPWTQHLHHIHLNTLLRDTNVVFLMI